MTASARSVCVFCGSRPGADEAFGSDAEALGTGLAERGWRLVYGAGDVGLMGTVARSAQAAGGQTFGVIPVHLLGLEVGKKDLTHLVVTENMHERKKVMFMNSDAIVVLPGGAGTLDEFFEVVTWAQLGLHGKPIVLLNTKGYWSPLTGLIDHVIGQGFADASLKRFLATADSVPELFEALEAKLKPA